jgi:hypothetical protein
MVTVGDSAVAVASACARTVTAESATGIGAARTAERSGATEGRAGATKDDADDATAGRSETETAGRPAKAGVLDILRWNELAATGMGVWTCMSPSNFFVSSVRLGVS